MMNLNQESKAILILTLVTAIWGSTFVLLQDAVRFINPIDFVFLRAVLASVCFIALVYKRITNTDLFIVKCGFMIGMFIAATFIFQTEGLQTIPASRSAFISGTCIVIVPILAPVFGLNKPRAIEWFAATMCIIGLYILTGANLTKLSIGDLWTIGCAFSYAFTILLLQVVTKKSNKSTLLSFYATIFTILPPAILMPPLHLQALSHWQVSFALIFCAIFASALVTYLMFTYQKHTTVTKATVTYALEPVFATLFALMFTNQKLTIELLIGGSIIFISVILPNIIPTKVSNNLADSNQVPS